MVKDFREKEKRDCSFWLNNFSWIFSGLVLLNFIVFHLASLTSYPQSNVNRLCAKLVPFLSTFDKKYVDSGIFEERDIARRKFKHKVAPYLKHVTLIVDTTVLTLFHWFILTLTLTLTLAFILFFILSSLMFESVTNKWNDTLIKIPR
jgi:hypothetical protein